MNKKRGLKYRGDILVKRSINSVKECLTGVEMTMSESINEDTKFEKIKWLSKYVSHLQPYTLYLTDEATLRKYLECRKIEFAEGACFFCTGNTDSGMPENIQDIPCIYISEEFDLALIGNKLLDYWGELDEWCRRLDVMVYSHKNLQEFFDVSAKYFSSALLLWDKSFNILASTSIETLNSPIMDEAVELGYFTKEIIENIIKRNLLDVKVDNYTTRFVPAESTCSKRNLLVRHFCKDGFRLYTIAYFQGSGAVEQAERERLECLFDHIINYFLETDQPVNDQHLSVNVFFCDILSGKINNPLEIEEKAKAFHINQDNRYLCYVLDFEEYSKTKSRYVVNYFDRVMPTEHNFEYGQNVVCIKNINTYNCLKLDRVGSFEHLLYTCMAHCGISSTFSSLQQIPDAFKQSQAAIRLGLLMKQETGYIFFYKNYYYYHMLEIVNKEINLRMIYYKELNVLLEDDKKHHTNNFNLLEVLLKNNLSVTDTAAELYLHRNSVIYRMKKLEQIMKIDFGNSDEVQRLYFSLMSHRYLTALEQKEDKT